MRLPRFTTRRLMALVAASAVLLAVGFEVWRLVQISWACRRRATDCALTGQLMSAKATVAQQHARVAEERLSAFRAGRVPVSLGDPERSMLIRSSQENPVAHKRWLDDQAAAEELLLSVLNDEVKS